MEFNIIILAAYYYPLPSSFNWIVQQSTQQVVYPNPLQPVYQQMVQYQAPSSPQYYIPAQQINQSYNAYNVNAYENGYFMNGFQSGNEYYNRGQNGRGNSKGHHW